MCPLPRLILSVSPAGDHPGETYKLFAVSDKRSSSPPVTGPAHPLFAKINAKLKANGDERFLDGPHPMLGGPVYTLRRSSDERIIEGGMDHTHLERLAKHLV